MSRFPPLVDMQRRALFEILEAFRKHDLEGRPVIVVTELGYPRLILSMGEESPHIDTDLDTLRVLDEAGYIAFTEMPEYDGAGSPYMVRSLTLKKLASDYYDWAHRPPIYRSLSGFWYSLGPFVLPALISSIFTLLVWMILNWLFGGGLSILP